MGMSMIDEMVSCMLREMESIDDLRKIKRLLNFHRKDLKNGFRFIFAEHSLMINRWHEDWKNIGDLHVYRCDGNDFWRVGRSEGIVGCGGNPKSTDFIWDTVEGLMAAIKKKAYGPEFQLMKKVEVNPIEAGLNPEESKIDLIIVETMLKKIFPEEWEKWSREE